MIAELERIASSIAAGYKRRMRQRARDAALYGIAGLILLTAYAAAIGGLALYLAQRFGPITGLFILSGSAVLLALILILIIRRQAAAEARFEAALAEARQSTLATVLTLIPGAGSATGVAILAALGFAAGLSMGKDAGKDDPPKDG
ncbi:MAG: hypothetical protein V4747_01085 [Pseudomonadota bacterium]